MRNKKVNKAQSHQDAAILRSAAVLTGRPTPPPCGGERNYRSKKKKMKQKKGGFKLIYLFLKRKEEKKHFSTEAEQTSHFFPLLLFWNVYNQKINTRQVAGTE